MTVVETQTLTGRVVFQYFYDCGGEIDLEKVSRENLRLISRVAPKRARVLAPKYEEVGLQPLEVELATENIDGHEAKILGKIFPIGVIEIYVAVDFHNSNLKNLIKLVRLDERPVKFQGDVVEFEAITRRLFEELLNLIKPAIVFPYPAFKTPEPYTLIMITKSAPKLAAKDFLRRFRKQTAGILRGEKEWRKLSSKEVEDALKSYLSYSDDDIVIIDWYAALMYGAVDYMGELERMVELAKIQLLELKTYDRLLDKRLERAYDSLHTVFTKPGVGTLWGRRWYGRLSAAAGELAEWRVEVTNLVEDMRNILKFTGDWYLGKVYRASSERFRIQDWLASVDKKLVQLQELYAMAMERIDVHRARILELLIVILIAIEVIRALIVS
ncbi:MAG: hypothetical protein ACUVQM_02495 [Candidatus Hadarchaeaceae archaeon]